jgi:hypothetical protein
MSVIGFGDAIDSVNRVCVEWPVGAATYRRNLWSLASLKQQWYKSRRISLLFILISANEMWLVPLLFFFFAFLCCCERGGSGLHSARDSRYKSCEIINTYVIEWRRPSTCVLRHACGDLGTGYTHARWHAILSAMSIIRQGSCPSPITSKSLSMYSPAFFFVMYLAGDTLSYLLTRFTRARISLTHQNKNCRCHTITQPTIFILISQRYSHARESHM